MIKRLCCILTLGIILLTGSVNVLCNTNKTDTSEDFRAVWVSSVLNLDYPSKPGLSNAELKSEADYILDRAVELGMNAIVLQVRPAGDALYKSNIFPWSEYLTGVQGQAPADGFDPLAYWVEEAHKRGLELHAWLNPYRVTHSTKKITDVNQLSVNNMARKNPSLVVPYGSALYYNPGLPECQQLIVNGIVEILTNYDVDGIHLDDYFYPGTDFNDADAYAFFGTGQSKDDWRRENVNNLIKAIQQAVRVTKPSARFGVSPFAIWQNKTSDELGSETSGFESYRSIYSDSRRWVKEGWLDYVAPQIYWYIGFGTADYAKVLSWWADVIEGTDVDLYIGTAAYREHEKQDNWTGEVLRQLELCQSYEAVKGHIFFRMGSLTSSVGNQIKSWYAKDTQLSQAPQAPQYQAIPHENTIVMTKLEVVQPSSDVSITGKGYYFFGSCDPNEELYVNGWLVEDKTAEGFFSVYAPLDLGTTSITFTQAGQTPVTRNITIKTAATPGPVKDPIKINELPSNTPYYATVTAETTWIYPGNTVTGGSSWELVKGQQDRVTAVTEDSQWARLSCGGWVEMKDVSCVTESALRADALTNGTYFRDNNRNIILWNASANPVSYTKYENNTLTMYFGMQNAPPDLDLIGRNTLNDTIFQSIAGGIENGVSYYAFTFRDDVKLEGYYAEFSEGKYRLIIETRKSLAQESRPLEGFTFVVDAGHGGTDIGAKGPMGASLAEKHLNLSIALKLAECLEAQGAVVTLTRVTDVYLTTYERTEISRFVNPDMFISIHCNSLAETTDATAVRGLTVWYRNESSRPLAASFAQSLHTANPQTTRRADPNQSNFYVCRPSWAPSVLIETSFINNIYDFAWLINTSNQNTLADAITKAVLEYYR